MPNRHAARKAAGKALQCLWGKRDLRHQHNYLAIVRQSLCDGPQIKLSFA
jgi:hypothetical protein